MPLQLAEILKEYKVWWDKQKSLRGDLWDGYDRLFMGEIKPINPCTSGSWLRHFEAKHGLDHVPPHSLRHTSITLQIIAGVPVKAVSERAGHANEGITLGIYTHHLKDEDKKAAQKFDDFMKV